MGAAEKVVRDEGKKKAKREKGEKEEKGEKGEKGEEFFWRKVLKDGPMGRRCEGRGGDNWVMWG